MNKQKTLRQGQILRLVTREAIENQDALCRRLRAEGLRVTQATVSRDVHELRLVKTDRGYQPLAVEAAPAALPRMARETIRDLRPAQNLLVLKTPPGGAQSLGAALDAEGWPEVVGTVAGDDTILVISGNARQRVTVEKRLKDMLA
ncbi:MAG TPA: ArgR family transcriptional regulator [Candidatus Binatia bacterium]|nr:ArgR family transcriptional regulator [Candidatus Binatia bacterium]